LAKTLKQLQISRAGLFTRAKHCPVFFALVFASFSRYNVCKKTVFAGGLSAER